MSWSWRISIIGGYGSGKTNSLFSLISQQPDLDKIYLYDKNPCKAKCQFLINKQGCTELNHLNDSKAFIEYSNGMDGVSKNIEEYNPNKKSKMLIVFNDMITDILSNDSIT